jgi:hypothetical protein
LFVTVLNEDKTAPGRDTPGGHARSHSNPYESKAA